MSMYMNLSYTSKYHLFYQYYGFGLNIVLCVHSTQSQYFSHVATPLFCSLGVLMEPGYFPDLSSQETEARIRRKRGVPGGTLPWK